MLIDWFTVGAEAINFLILMWLLKRFLYKPILDAIESREQKIAAELADAATKKPRRKMNGRNSNTRTRNSISNVPI
jgi:F0F1-type ATP synthase membrane subunit b/b'